MSGEVTQHQVQGVCEVVQMRGDWMEFAVELPGKQYPVKLSSKQPAVKEAAQAAVAAKAMAVWSYSERDGNPNPHRPGEFFKNRYLESVVIGGTLDPALAGQSTHQDAPDGGGAGAARMPTDGREQSIERQSIVKALAPLLSLDPEIMPEDRFFALLDRVDDWMGRVRAKPPQEQTNEPVDDGPHQDGEYAHQDDDIPF